MDAHGFVVPEGLRAQAVQTEREGEQQGEEKEDAVEGEMRE
jgi:hypothetical protein